MSSTQRRLLAICTLLVLGSWIGSRPAATQTKPGKPAAPAPAKAKESEQFIDVVNVSVVNVDAYVTDKKGNPVTGLTRDDFELFENKRPVQITNFYSVSGGKATAPGTPAPPTAPAAPGAAIAVPLPPQELDARPSEDQRLRLVLYVDNYTLRPFNRNRVMRELRAFIGQKLRRDDLIMLVTYDRELHTRHTFTSDPAQIASIM